MDQIDFSAFSTEDFDPVEWLNKIFPEEINDDIKFNNHQENTATNLVYKLQLMVEETNNSLEEIAQRMVLSLPKVIGEADVLSQEASQLCNQVNDVRTKLICSQQQQSDVVENLIYLDKAKKRMQDTFKALEEANNWTTLSMDVEEVFESGDMNQIANKLVNMQKSLEMLSLSSSSNNQHQSKIQILETLKDRFEKLVEPILVDSFLSQSSESVEFYSKLFKEFHRANRLITWYKSCIREQLLKEWTRQVKLDSEENLLNWLNFLYDQLISIWKSQFNFCMKFLYPDDFSMSIQFLCDIYTDIIMSLEPSIESCFHQYLAQSDILNNNSKNSKQKCMIELKHFTNSFIKSFEQNIVSQYSGTEDIAELIPKIKSIDSFIRCIYQPFANFNSLFLQLEKARLDTEFEEMNSSFDNVINSEYVIKLFVIVRDSLKLYTQYVETYPILIVEDIIEEFLIRYLNLTKEKLNEMQNEKSLLDYNSRDYNKSSMKLSSSNVSLQSLSSPNWTLIQKRLLSFQIVGEFINQFHNFRQQIFLTFKENQSGQQNNSSHLFPDESTSVRVIPYFSRFDLFILSLDSNAEINNRLQKYIDSDANDILSNVQNESVQLAKLCGQSIIDSILEYVQVHLNSFTDSILQYMNCNSQQTQSSYGEMANNSTLDDSLSFSPNENITQIGQYLLTLPQHLEPFNPNENNSFKAALKNSIDIFYNSNNSDSLIYFADHRNTYDVDEHSEVLLDSILCITTSAFVNSIVKLSNVTIGSKGSKKLNASVRKQIGTDSAYLAAVCEDLGFVNDKGFHILIQVFNEVDTLENFQKLMEENPEQHKILNALKELIVFQ